MRRSLKLLSLIVLELVILGGLVGFALFIPSSGGGSPSSGATAHFTIIESDRGPDAGMNGSYYKNVKTQWPVIHVQKGDTVVILVENVNSSEPHGFAIDHYFDTPSGVGPYQGVELQSGQSYTVTFVANEAGSFRIFCSVFCAIHPTMQNGLLVVS